MIGVSDPAPRPAPANPVPPQRLGAFIDRSKLATTVPIYAAIALIWIFFESQTGGRFIGARNLSEMAQEYSYKPLLAIGVVFVLLLGEIDLSVGYLTLLCATTVAVLSAFGPPAFYPPQQAVLYGYRSGVVMVAARWGWLFLPVGLVVALLLR